jgi:glyoxylase-like metal-dependent hydrolase (beta-lactamase superfamily II)
MWTVDVLLEGTSYSSTCTLLTSRAHRVLVDTGLSIQEGDLRKALARRGLEPADIDLVVNTHLHLDHCGNNSLFTRAAIVMSKAEWTWTCAFYDSIFSTKTPELVVATSYPEFASHHLPTRTIRNVARLAKLFWKAERLGGLDQIRWLEATDVPAGLTVIASPGHTPHHVSIRVEAEVPTLVTGDAVLAEAATAKVRTMIPYNNAQFLATRDELLSSAAASFRDTGRRSSTVPA